MRWNREVKVVPRLGETRIRRIFAWLPRATKTETRWLEWCMIKQQYYPGHWGHGAYWGFLGFADHLEQPCDQ